MRGSGTLVCEMALHDAGPGSILSAGTVLLLKKKIGLILLFPYGASSGVCLTSISKLLSAPGNLFARAARGRHGRPLGNTKIQ